MSFNRIQLVGNLGRDPELRYTPQGTPVCSFSMATNDRKKGKDGEYEQVTTWFKVTCFGQQAESAAQYLVQGKQVFVEGRLQMEEWADKEGKARTSLIVMANGVQFLGSKRDADEEEQERPARRSSSKKGGSKRAAAPPVEDDDEDDIPF